MSEPLKTPFPWFGGKSRIAGPVWDALGDVYNYVEPFAGSLAVLLARPETHTGYVESVNDLDAYLVNFWRAVQHDPAAVAHYANNPVNETDLLARHIWLVNTGADRLSQLSANPEYYDPKVAGWWVWGICAWIGGGWCAGNGPWSEQDGRLVYRGAGRGVGRRRVHLGRGEGVHRKRVHQEAASRGVETGEAEIRQIMDALAARLRNVRVCQGDWRRVVTKGALSHGSTVGIFLDPPYSTELREGNLYNTDQTNGATISGEVRKWCLTNGDNPRYRIVLAGYEGEHEMPDTWRVIQWSSVASYQRSSGGTANAENRHKERLWLSPGCLGEKTDNRTSALPLFGWDDES